jgi:hypothetical protein
MQNSWATVTVSSGGRRFNCIHADQLRESHSLVRWSQVQFYPCRSAERQSQSRQVIVGSVGSMQISWETATVSSGDSRFSYVYAKLVRESHRIIRWWYGSVISKQRSVRQPIVNRWLRLCYLHAEQPENGKRILGIWIRIRNFHISFGSGSDPDVILIFTIEFPFLNFL